MPRTQSRVPQRRGEAHSRRGLVAQVETSLQNLFEKVEKRTLDLKQDRILFTSIFDLTSRLPAEALFESGIGALLTRLKEAAGQYAEEKEYAILRLQIDNEIDKIKQQLIGGFFAGRKPPGPVKAPQRPPRRARAQAKRGPGAKTAEAKMEDIVTVDEENEHLPGRQTRGAEREAGLKVGRKIKFKVCRKLAQQFCRGRSIDVRTKKAFEKLSQRTEAFLARSSRSMKEYQAGFLRIVKGLSQDPRLTRLFLGRAAKPPLAPDFENSLR